MQGLNLQKYKIQLAIFKFSKHANSDLGIDDDICSVFLVRKRSIVLHSHTHVSDFLDFLFTINIPSAFHTCVFKKQQ